MFMPDDFLLSSTGLSPPLAKPTPSPKRGNVWVDCPVPKASPKRNTERTWVIFVPAPNGCLLPAGHSHTKLTLLHSGLVGSLINHPPTHTHTHIYIYIYILSFTDRLFRCITTLQYGYTAWDASSRDRNPADFTSVGYLTPDLCYFQRKKNNFLYFVYIVYINAYRYLESSTYERSNCISVYVAAGRFPY